MLFQIWTKQRLYDQYGDRSYVFFIHHQGLLREDQMEATLEYLMANNMDQLPLTKRIQLVLNELDERQWDLLAKMLQPDPHRRITLEGILQHEWLQQQRNGPHRQASV